MFSVFRITVAVVCLLTAVCLHALVCGNSLSAEWELLASLLVLAPLAASFSGGYGVQDVDATLKLTLVLPNAANTTVNTATGIDTKASSISDFVAHCELLLSAPALNVTQLPNTDTVTYNLIASPNSNLAGAVTLATSLLVQTGSTGAAAATARFRLPTNIAVTGRYVALQAVSGTNAANMAAASATLQLLF